MSFGVLSILYFVPFSFVILFSTCFQNIANLLESQFKVRIEIDIQVAFATSQLDCCTTCITLQLMKFDHWK
jgi:hypothetical protein